MTHGPSPLSADKVAVLLADTSPYLSCDECFDRLDEYVERQVEDPRFREPAMDAHLRGCGACAEEATTLRELLTQDGR